MATVIFKKPSPYTTPLPDPPADDFLFSNYLETVNIDPSKFNDSKKTVVALFGAGRAGSIHLTNLAHNHRVKLAYVVDDAENKWENIKRFWKLENTTFLTSKEADRVYKDEEVDAVVVASPTYTHEEIVRNSLNNGKAVFCEKPIAGDIKTTAAMYELAEKKGKPLFCAFNRRFDPAYGHLRKEVRAGKVGHVHTIKIVARDSPLPPVEYIRTSGGIFHDCAIHDIDMMCWILGELPNKVFAAATSNIPEIGALDDFDTVAAILQFPSGTMGMIDISRNANYGYDQRIEVFGPGGMVECTNERPMCGYDTSAGVEGLKKTAIYYSFASRYQLAYAREFEHFLQVIDGREKLSVLGKQTLAASKIASAMEHSAKTGDYVKLEWEPHEIPPTDI